MKPILATRQNQPEFMPAKKNIAKRKSRELENVATAPRRRLLAEKILTKTAYLKSATAKNGFEFLSQSQNETCESNMVLHLLFGAASQRLALAAWGGRVESLSKRKKPKAAKKLQITRRVPQVGCTLCWLAVLEISLLFAN